jgi:hypothetical protein
MSEVEGTFVWETPRGSIWIGGCVGRNDGLAYCRRNWKHQMNETHERGDHHFTTERFKFLPNVLPGTVTEYLMNAVDNIR